MSNKHWIVALALGATLITTSYEAWAGRLGNGRSVGKQSSGITQRQATPQTPQGPQAAPGPQGAQGAQAPAAAPRQAQPQTPGMAQPQAARNRWLAPLAGIAAGLGLAALASYLGFGEELASFMLIALMVLAAFVIFRLFAARRAAANPQAAARTPAFSYQGVGQEASVSGWQPPAEPVRHDPQVVRPAYAGGAAAASAPAGLVIPEGFDTEGFLREARRQFVRMQTAWDAGDEPSLRAFTTDAMFRQLKADLDARGASANRTDVVKLDAEMLGVETDATEYTASVRFHGMVREQEGSAAQAFDEVWNLTKPLDGSQGWLLAGVQQLS